MQIGLISLKNPGNLKSVARSLKRCGHESVVLSSYSDFDKQTLDAIILPGVGSFENSISLMKDCRFDELILRLHNENFKIIGLCLGFQLLTNSSVESKSSREIKGLNIFPDISLVDLCSKNKKMNLGLKRLYSLNNSELIDKKYFYFMHRFGYIIEDDVPNYVDSWCIHSNLKLAAICKLNNTWGIQFHPEKSGEDGDTILNQILNKN